MIGRADTIFGIATARGQAGIAVMRVSGSETDRLVKSLAGDLPAPRRASLRRLTGEDGPIDRGLVLRFPGPQSYTGEDCAEFHLHGGEAVLQAMAEALLRGGARAAEPGEFTRRAFLSNRIDLIEAEGIADLIAARTPAQRLQALAQAEGEPSSVVAAWSAELRHILAMEEAAIDFPDETGDATVPMSRLACLADEIGMHLRDGAAASRLRDGLRIAVIGAPNVGKSSLVNRLAGRDVAIVSAHPGTTRDVLEAGLLIAGVPVTIGDTAGQRETTDEIEREGIRRARRAADLADIVIEVLAADHAPPASMDAPAETLRVTNKIDLGHPHPGSLGLSARDGIGLDALRDALATRVIALTRHDGAPVMTNARHRGCLEEAARHLQTAASQPAPELRAEDVREAMRCLGRLTGVVDTEMLLDTIFSSFCIGK